MKNVAKTFVLLMFTKFVFTACEAAAVNEDQDLYEDFQGVDRSVQRPGSQGDNGNDCED